MKAEDDGKRMTLPRGLAILAQLGLLTWVVYQFRLEGQHFLHLLMLTCVGFPIHAALPQKARLRFFVLLSLVALGMVLGPKHAALLVVIGSGLIALCHLPVSWAWRHAALLVAGGILILARARIFVLVRDETFWQVLGSIFMFRLVVYMHDLRHAKLAPSLSWSLSYFFLLPNVCFPLFPVVDYRKFRQSYYKGEPHEIHQRGISWMFRGVYQLVLYRFIYHYLAIDPVEIVGEKQLLIYLFSAFLLYLRVSGQFHMIIGLLLLFGFNLPETHHRYFLASSLMDFWRRINIYWKDFMMKIVFYPSYDKLRRFGEEKALVLATAVVFVCTWLLHSYQWFWITGSYLLAWNDSLFWAILGILVIGNSLYESRHGRKRTLGRKTVSLSERVATGLRRVGTFTVISILWSMWSSDSLGQWLTLAATSPRLWWALGGFVAALFATAFAVEKWAFAVEQRSQGSSRPSPVGKRGLAPPSFWRHAGFATAGGLCVLLLGAPVVYGRLGPEAEAFVESLRFSGLNQRDANARNRGYYEELIGANQRHAALNTTYTWKPEDWLLISETGVWRERPDMLLGELVPNQEITFKRALLTTNQWGLRDRDYSLEKPAGVYRLAVLGSSHVMGSGVGDEDTFEARYEKRLSEVAGEGQFEVLNFAAGGYRLGQNLFTLDHRVFDFEPDAVLQVSHASDVYQAGEYLGELVSGRREILYPRLREIVAAAGADPGVSKEVNARRLWPHRWEAIEWLYRQIAERCRASGVVPIWALLPVLGSHAPDDVEALTRLAEEAGFVIVDLSGVYHGFSSTKLRLAAWDEHPNALGHRLIAERLHEVMDGRRLLQWTAVERSASP